MKKLVKLNKPAVLVANEARWTEAYKSAQSDELRKHEKWGHSDIKETLQRETDGKCAYCESSIGHISYPNVEHIIPKSRHRELAHVWSNLTSACTRCNVLKGNYYDEHDAVLNPYRDDVHAALVFHGDFVTSPLGQNRAEITINCLDLNRPDLVVARVERLRAIQSLLARWHAAVDPARMILAQAIQLDSQRGQHTRAVQSLLNAHQFPWQ